MSSYTEVLCAFVLISVGLHTVIGVAPPSYLHLCKGDENLNKCALESGRDAIPIFVKGDQKLQIPVLDPFHLDEVSVDQGTGPVQIALNCKDLVVHGLKYTELKDINVDLDKKVIELTLLMPSLEVLGKYTINGRVLILPITGTGDMNVTAVSFNCKYNAAYELIKKKPGGKNYLKLTNSDFTFNPKRVYYHFDNLFNGDSNLGDHMNNFLNDNWQEVNNEIGPVIAEVVRSIIDRILTSIATNVYFDDIILPA